MQATRRHRHLTTWIALVAMLAFALVPTLSRAMTFATGNTAWAEICTPQGMKLVSVGDADSSGAPAQVGSHLDHCALCSMAADGAAPLPATAPALVLPLASAEPPRLFLQAATPQHAWRSAPARAPPAFS